MTAYSQPPEPLDWRQVLVPAGTEQGSQMTGHTGTVARGQASEVTFAGKGAGPSLPAGGTSLDQFTYDQAESPRVAPAVVLVPVQPPPRQQFIPLSRREGVVLELRGDEFDARLVDLNGEEEDLEGTFALDEVSPDDLPLLKSGAVFYWTIGYFDDRVGRRTRVSELRFRRLPADDSRLFDEAGRKADELRTLLGIE